VVSVDDHVRKEAMPKIYNVRNDNAPPDAVKIDRSTVYGNPYTHLKGLTKAEFTVNSRNEAVEAYREYFNSRVLKDIEFADAVEQLRDKDLLCWCAPLPCHGMIILDYLRETEI